MDLQKEFKKFFFDQKLLSDNDRVLLAVSGGVDSVVMAELFHRHSMKFAIAHCNFQLRGKESEGDEEFVKALAKKYKAKFFCRKFDTEEYAADHKLSIQEAARNLRYEWFFNLLKKEKYHRIATAHHLNDNIETFFINLLRGTGLTGLRGIQKSSRNSTLIRPLLFASRKDIETFAKTERLGFRNDSSNSTDDYLRNRIRHHLIPLLEDLNPQFETVMKRNMQEFEFAESVFSQTICLEYEKMLHQDKGQAYFDRKELQEKKYPVQMLAEFLKAQAFNSAQAFDIWNTTKSGKQFFAKEHTITVDRGKILLNKTQYQANEEFFLLKNSSGFSHQLFTLNLQVLLKKKPVEAASNIHYLDFAKLKFPLTVRKWKTGDFFYPLGMKQRKKISDFLIDKKISRPEKENVYVIITGKDIAGVLGHRVDERYKITDGTKKVYRIEYLRT